MMRLSRRTLWRAGAALVAAAILPARAADRAGADDAVALVRKVVDYLKKHGRDKAIAEIQAGGFRDRDLYVSINGINGISYANGGNPRMVGKNLSGLRDADGKDIQKERVAMALAKGKGWQEFRWVDPVAGEMTQKRTYFEKVDDLLVSCGIYQPGGKDSR